MKNIKLILTFLGLIVSANMSFAQSNEAGLTDFDRIGIAAYVSNQVEYLPVGARSNLSSKLGQIISANGFGNSVFNSRFILTPNIEVASKNVIAGAPPKVALVLNVYLFVGDGFEGTKFGSTMLTVKGVGNNENKAYINALKQIKPGNPAIKQMISSAKQRILDYYNTQCDFILKDAEVAAAQNDFDQALFILTSIPKINYECYEKATSLIGPVYQQKINRDCQVKLQSARNAWNTSQDYEAALDAVDYLSAIEPSSDCYRDAQRLSNDIGRRMRELENREWNFVLKNQDLAGQKIDAARAVGVAYGENQPQNMTYNLLGWW